MEEDNPILKLLRKHMPKRDPFLDMGVTITKPLKNAEELRLALTLSSVPGGKKAWEKYETQKDDS